MMITQPALDHILVWRRWCSSITQCRVFWSDHLGNTDHWLLSSKLRFKLKAEPKLSGVQNFNLEKLQYPEIKWIPLNRGVGLELFHRFKGSFHRRRNPPAVSSRFDFRLFFSFWWNIFTNWRRRDGKQPGSDCCNYFYGESRKHSKTESFDIWDDLSSFIATLCGWYPRALVEFNRYLTSILGLLEWVKRKHQFQNGNGEWWPLAFLRRQHQSPMWWTDLQSLSKNDTHQSVHSSLLGASC